MMFKTYIKSMLCSILLIFMSTSVFAVKNTFGVLCYHHVVNESILKKENQYYPQTISVQMLVDHFIWLKHNGYTPRKEILLKIADYFNVSVDYLSRGQRVDPAYLQAYLDEFVFRFNRRQIPMAAFQTLLGITSNKDHVSLVQLRS